MNCCAEAFPEVWVADKSHFGLMYGFCARGDTNSLMPLEEADECAERKAGKPEEGLWRESTTTANEKVRMSLCLRVRTSVRLDTGVDLHLTSQIRGARDQMPRKEFHFIRRPEAGRTRQPILHSILFILPGCVM